MKTLIKWWKRRKLNKKKYLVKIVSKQHSNVVLLWWCPGNWCLYTFDTKRKSNKKVIIYKEEVLQNEYYTKDTNEYSPYTMAENIATFKEVYDQYLTELQEIELL